jgi:zinc transporter 1/2/3
MFGNSCLGTLEYEATTTSIAMAGIFLSFIIEFIGQRLVANRAARSASKTPSIVTENERSFSKNVVEVEGGPPGAKTTNNTTLADLGHAHAHTARSGSEEGDEHFSVAVMEAGIIFHSIRASLHYFQWCFPILFTSYHTPFIQPRATGPNIMQ